MSTAPETTNQDRVATSVRLLPLSKDPFQAPTDRDMLPSERRLFVQTHRTCVFGYGRRSDGPGASRTTGESWLSFVGSVDIVFVDEALADRDKRIHQ